MSDYNKTFHVESGLRDAMRMLANEAVEKVAGCATRNSGVS
jgi:hypothetical protein